MHGREDRTGALNWDCLHGQQMTLQEWGHHMHEQDCMRSKGATQMGTLCMTLETPHKHRHMAVRLTALHTPPHTTQPHPIPSHATPTPLHPNPLHCTAHSMTVLDHCFRVWDSTSGKQLCCLQGHKGRGVWRCLLHPDQDRLITAGADSSIKIWRLADWMPAHHPLAAQTSEAFTLPPLPTAAGAFPLLC